MEDGRGKNGGQEKIKSEGGGEIADEEEAMKKCLEENKGDTAKCKPMVEALKSFPTMKPITPLMLKPGSLTDV